MTVAGNGKAVQDITPSWKDKREEDTLKSFSLLEREVEEIYINLKDAAFFTRPTGATEFCMDSAAMVLKVTMDGNAFRYMIQDVSCGSVDDDIVRTVTKMLLKKIPSPNNNRELKIFGIESNALESTSIHSIAPPMRSENRNTEAGNKNNANEKIDQPVGSEFKQEEMAPANKLAVYREEYGDFINRLNLSEDKSKKILNLIWLLNSWRWDGKIESQKVREKNLRNFLGAKDYAAFEEYNKLSSERYIVNGFIKSLGPDTQLDDRKKEEMIQAMYKAREQLESNPQADKSQSSHDKSYLASVNNILSDADIGKLKEYFNKRKNLSVE